MRSHPRLLGRLFRAALEEGAQRLTLCDTVGHATPDGVFNLVHFTKNILRAGDFNAKLTGMATMTAGMLSPTP